MKEFVKKYGYNKYSQNGEDGVIEEILRRLQIEHGTFCEFGAADGIFMSNTRVLAEKGWDGFYYEADDNFTSKLLENIMGLPGKIIGGRVMLTPENINSIVPQKLDLLSMDTEGLDYSLWKAYTGLAKVVVIEINGSFYAHERFVHSDADPRGSSHLSMVELGREKGYTLICSTGNLIFVRKEFIGTTTFPEFVEFDKARDQDKWIFDFFNDGWTEVKAITEERWHEAQVDEQAMHDRVSMEEGLAMWGKDYKIYFSRLGMTWHQGGKTIIEVGCAGFPALHFCSGYEKGYLVEPMPSENLLSIAGMHDRLEVVKQKFEDVEIKGADEIWLFNVLQHVKDPNLFLKKARELAPVVRFFEPVNWPTCSFHPHTFTYDYYERQFSAAAVQRYKGSSIPNFHEADCAYGIWFDPKVYDKKQHIGILTTATWKFQDFIPQFLLGVANFLPGYKKTIFLFTDQHENKNIDSRYIEVIHPDIDVVYIPVTHVKFPLITLERYARYMSYNALYRDTCDFLFHLDIDMKINECGEEVLQPLVAVQHPYFFDGGGSWEDNQRSMAYVKPEDRKFYVCGGVQGGQTKNYLNVCETLAMQVDMDKANGQMARWHDESHWNSLFAKLKDGISLLNPAYCHSRGIDFPKRIEAIDKDMAAYREE